MKVGRRAFLNSGAAALGGSLLFEPGFRFLQALETIDNPLAFYPNRGWEKTYRDQYHYDSAFNFLCLPNDTHNCRLTAFVRDGVAVRVEQAYDVGDTKDLYGNKASPAWGPRGCLKGYSVTQRVYSAHRLKFPTIVGSPGTELEFAL